MNWEAVSAIGQIVGTLAVVFTLGVVAFQLRENTKSNNLSTVNSYMQAYGALTSRMANSTDMASLSRRGHSNLTELTEDERQRFFSHMSEFMVLWESMWRMWNSGLVKDDHWMIAREDIVANLASPGGKTYLDNVLPIYKAHLPKFASQLEKCAESIPIYSSNLA